MEPGNGLKLSLGKYQKRLAVRLRMMDNSNFVHRLWNKDESLYKKGTNSADLLMGWLELPDKMLQALPAINDFCKEVRTAGFGHVVLLGMGGSSLAPLVFQKTFGDSVNGIKLTVLDTTEPETIKKIESGLDLPSTLFIVSSKSGNTAEVMAFYEYFYYRVAAGKRENAGENFIAITDQGSPLVQLAARKKFRKTFINFSDVGGRFSALSYFGIVPAALMGINVKEVLLRAKAMAIACGPLVPAHENTGVMLGAAMAEMSSKGCDKLTYLMPEGLDSFGLWLEQLVAESTGKEGKGILPFNGLPLCTTKAYGKDRFFVKYGFCGEENDLQSMMPSDLISMKYPFINILMKDELDLGKEFFRWEIATAVAGAILDINPFDQPNVQESKKFTDSLLKQVERDGELPKMEPALSEDEITYYGGQKEENGKMTLEALLKKAKAGDYIAFQAYLPEAPAVEELLNEMKKTVQNNLGMPVSVQFGPRYLHSTGQFHKGGPNTGYFIQFICNSTVDIHIPEHNYTFGMLKRAQAIGDMEALATHKRKVILVDLGEDFIRGLETFKKVVDTLQPPAKIAANRMTAYRKAQKDMMLAERNSKEVQEAVVLLQGPAVSRPEAESQEK
ncbi:MAG: bifunctional transaldolase/phosoglucose isomerase [Bacteroidetes bacterium]|nr:bifunctional transaldolase/phosoglucose isomerase [Bacteroidota bacterium]